MGRDNRIAIVTIHGTGDTAAEPDGEANGGRWFQTRSKFVARLKQRLGAGGVEADIIPFLWSGDNSAIARDKGSSQLAAKLKRLGGRYHGRVHLICHSHGGNVGNDAAVRLNWSSQQKRPKLASVTTVGTPFFRSRVSGGDRFGAWVFLIVVVSSLLLIPAITFYAGDAVTSALRDLVNLPLKDSAFAETRQQFEVVASQQDEARPILNWLGANALMVASAIALLFMVPLAVRGLRRTARAGRAARADTKFYTIWHDNDEAVAFLSRVEKLPLEPFPRWSLFRGSRTGGVTWGVRVLIVLNLIGLIILGYDIVVRGVDVVDNPYSTAGIYFLIAGIAGAPVVFSAVYLLYRLFVALVLDISLRGTLNSSIGGSLKAIAMGRDGDHRIGEVSPRSHYYGSEDAVIGGEVAQRMIANSAAASQKLFDRYRGAVFSVSDEGNAINELTKDAMTWDSLIHTTYFDQPEVADMIGDHILRVAKGGPAHA